ncbi:hypothetical protein [Streptomyces sp. NPDC048659]|uniref:hypothetical protein n=1 Tax=Streptomyces sp. NPDC048659 TaxID=3155489 RepID=UPI00342FFB05
MLSAVTGVMVAWVRCALCCGVGRVTLGSGPMAPLLEDGRRHVEQAHPGEAAVRVLTLVTEDAGIFRGPDPRPAPEEWVRMLNERLVSDF